MTKLFLFLFIVMNTYPAHANDAGGGGQEGHGGDAFAYEFTEVARGFLDSAIRLQMQDLPRANFYQLLRTAIENTLVLSEEKVLLDGLEVDAANYPRRTPQPLILVSRSRWQQYFNQYKRKRVLVLHEYLSILDIPDERYEISSKLVDRVDYMERSARGGTQNDLFQAIQSCKISTVTNLLQNGANLNTRWNGGKNALHVAAEVGCPGLVELFLKLGLPVDALTELGWTPLFSAIWNLHYSAPGSAQRHLYCAVIHTLIKNGADVNLNTATTMESSLKFPAIIRSAQSILTRAMIGIYDLDSPGLYLPDDDTVVEMILSAPGINLNVGDSTDQTPLHYAVAYGRLDYLTLLISKGADPSLLNSNGESALELAATTHDRLFFIPALIHAGATPKNHTLVRALNALEKVDNEVLSVLRSLLSHKKLDANLGLMEVAKMTYRLIHRRGDRAAGPAVMKALVQAPSFSPDSCAAQNALAQWKSLASGRHAEAYEETYKVLAAAMKDNKSNKTCSH